MSDVKNKKGLKLANRRRKLGAAGSAVVNFTYHDNYENAPLVISPCVKDLNVNAWIRKEQSQIEALLQKHGAILFRGFDINGSESFSEFVRSMKGEELLPYQYRSTPRRELDANVFSSTEYPADYCIPLHNENSYTNSWASKVFLYCANINCKGGETPIADSRKIYQKIPEEIREEFEAKQLMYVRNFNDLDLPWQEVFQTDDAKEIDQYCQANNIQNSWLDDGTLQTRQVCQATHQHPISLENVWFNQAHLFHFSVLPHEVQVSMEELAQQNRLPRNVYFGDGSEIDSGLINEISRVYDEEKVMFPWQKRDVMLLDNVLFAHGRSSFDGERRIYVAMTN